MRLTWRIQSAMRLRLLLTFALVACGGNDATDDVCRFRTAADDVTPPPLDTRRWAFRPWIAKDISNRPDTSFIAGVQARDIPIATHLSA